MKVDGQLESAQLEELASASPTPTARSRIYSDITDISAPLPRFYDSSRFCQVRLRKEALTSVAGDTVLTAIAEKVKCDASGGAIALTLPAASSMTGEILYILKVDTTFNKVVITRAGSDTIDGATHSDLTSYYEWVKIRSNGTGWDTVEWGYDGGKHAFTPTGAWSANSTYTGFWWRTGDQINIEVNIALAGAPTSATLTVNLPVTLATAKMTGSSADVSPLMGFGFAFRATDYIIAPVYHSTTAILVAYDLGTGAMAAVDATHPGTFAAADFVQVFALNLPVSGWRSFLAV